MKKTIKTLGIVTFVTIVTLSFATCETINKMLSGEPAANSEAGEQVQTSQAAPEQAAPAQPAKSEPAPNQPSPVGTWKSTALQITFNANGTGKYDGRDIKWERKANGNQLMIHFLGSDVGDYWYSVEGNKLTLNAGNSYNPEYDQTFTRQ